MIPCIQYRMSGHLSMPPQLMLTDALLPVKRSAREVCIFRHQAFASLALSHWLCCQRKLNCRYYANIRGRSQVKTIPLKSITYGIHSPAMTAPVAYKYKAITRTANAHTSSALSRITCPPIQGAVPITFRIQP